MVTSLGFVGQVLSTCKEIKMGQVLEFRRATKDDLPKKVDGADAALNEIKQDFIADLFKAYMASELFWEEMQMTDYDVDCLRHILNKYSKEWDQRKHENPQLRQQAWKKTCTPCPLLQEGHCSVYDVRPLACRSFFSIHTPEWCHPLHPNNQKQPQIGHDDIHSLLENLSKQYGWPVSRDLISGLHHLIQEKHQ